MKMVILIMVIYLMIKEIIEVMLKGSIAVIYLFLVIKTLGKKQISELNIFDYIININSKSGIHYFINNIIALCEWDRLASQDNTIWNINGIIENNFIKRNFLSFFSI